jgi:hypothetical protein
MTTAEAAINHVVPPQPIRITVNSNAATFLDLDGDAQADLRFGAGFSSGPIGTYFFLGTARGFYDAELIGDDVIGSYSFAVRKFQADDVIPAVQPSLAGSILRTSVTAFGSQYQHNGNWGLNDTGFAGIVVAINSQPRAGWIKIRTESSSGHLGAVSILEWALQTDAGVSIMAGQTSAGGIPIPGDYNNNGTVGPEDYAVWKSTFGQNVTAGTGADGNSNTKIDAADYTVWRNNLGASGSGAAAGTVPEPSTVTLGVLALGAAGVAALRRRSK